MRRRPFIERFWMRVDRRGDDECWPWIGRTRVRGYGRIHSPTRGGQVLAHRVSWEIANGPIPDGQHVLHRCDNPGCVNPAHMFLGTHADNMRDMAAKCRNGGQPGTQHWNARLTRQQVDEIKESSGTLATIAARYGVSATHVGLIRSGQRWAANQ